MTNALTFGFPEPGIAYTERQAAYAVIATEAGRVAAVKGRDKYFLPGGGLLPDEGPEDTIIREVREELARDARLIRKIGEAVQYFYAATDDRHYRMQAVFFLAELTDHSSGLAKAEHELCWLPVTEAEHAFFHQSHAWAARYTEPKTDLNVGGH